MAYYRYYIPPHNIQLGYIRFWREPQPLFFVNIPSVILRPDKYNNPAMTILNSSFNQDSLSPIKTIAEREGGQFYDAKCDSNNASPPLIISCVPCCRNGPPGQAYTRKLRIKITKLSRVIRFQC